MSKSTEYLNEIEKIIESIKLNSAESVEATASAFKNALMNGNRIFLFGTGHSHMLAEELFYRAGGLVEIQPVLVPQLMLHISAHESTEIERRQGLAEEIFKEYKMSSEDVIVIISNSGRNGVVVDMALLCKSKGLTVIALTSLKHTMAGESRHRSGKRLCEIAHVTLDNYGCHGDACVSVEGVGGKICPTSTVSGAILLNMAVARCVEMCACDGYYPPHFQSANVDGGDEINDRLVAEYKKEIKHL